MHKPRTITPIHVDSALWATNLLPEGILERWLRSDGEYVKAGQAIALVRLEGAQHELVAPAEGWLTVERKINSVIEPGAVIARIETS